MSHLEHLPVMWSRDETQPNTSHHGEGRVLILCFDSTWNKFSQNSNIVRFFRALQKDDRKKQIVYYQPGIGTYNKHTFVNIANTVASTIDAATALDLDDHAKEGYQFIVQNYRPGDKICVFGFSRGAHTARVVAGMVYKVGIPPKENIQQVDYAFLLYSTTGDDGYKQSQDFKRTFTHASAPGHQVSVDFVGVWDTVSSVGIIPKAHPYTSVNYAVKRFRHALSLDERRAGFRPNVWSEITLAREHELDVDIPVPDFPQLGKSNRDAFVYEPPERDFADVKEVWFAGTHTDVGGGPSRSSSLSFIPLRWMIKECILNRTGIFFDLGYLKDDLDFDFDGLFKEIGNETENIFQYNELKTYRDAQLKERGGDHETEDTTNGTNHTEDGPIRRLYRGARDTFDEIFDPLLKARKWYLWWMLEVIPMHYSYQDYYGNWIRRRMPNFGRGRYIPVYKNKVLVHSSVKERIRKSGGEKQDEARTIVDLSTSENHAESDRLSHETEIQEPEVAEERNSNEDVAPVDINFVESLKGEWGKISEFFNILRDRFRNHEEYTPRAANWDYLQKHNIIEYVD